MKRIPCFLGLLLLFSAPLWLAADFFDATDIIPVKLPFSALQFLAVLLAAILVTRRRGGSVRALLLRGIDFKRIPTPLWHVSIFVLMPLTITLSYWITVWAGANGSHKMTPLLSLPLLLLVYGISGYSEQIGWTALMTDELLEDGHGVFVAGLLVGITWAVWHIIPFIQTHNTASWIFWQCIFTIIYRVLLTNVYVLTNCSVFSTTTMHATYNIAFSLMPYYGSSYHPAVMALATLYLTILVFMLPNQPFPKAASGAQVVEYSLLRPQACRGRASER